MDSHDFAPPLSPAQASEYPDIWDHEPLPDPSLNQSSSPTLPNSVPEELIIPVPAAHTIPDIPESCIDPRLLAPSINQPLRASSRNHLDLDLSRRPDDQLFFDDEHPLGNEPSFQEQSDINSGDMEIEPSSTAGHPALTDNSYPPQQNWALAALDKPMYMRVSSTSPAHIQPRVWMSTMPNPPTILAIHGLVHANHTHLGVQIVEIEVQTRSILMVTIDKDAELEKFLQDANGETPTFIFHLVDEISMACAQP